MADNRFNVDDILREINSKQSAPAERQRRERSEEDFWGEPASAGEQSAPPPQVPQRRAAPSPRDDRWEPVSSRPRERQYDQPQQRQPSPPPPRQQTLPPRQPQQSMPPQRQPQSPQRPMREAVTRQAQEPRLGQVPQRPKTREEMGRLLNQFDDSNEEPFGNLDFLSKEPESNYDKEENSIRSFTPDWDRPQPQPQPQPPQQQQPQRRQAPPQDYYRQEVPPQRRQARQEPPTQRVPQPPTQRQVPQGRTPTPYGNSIMQHNDRRNMADAARMITSGGFEDFPEEQHTAPRGRQSAPPIQRRTQAEPRYQQQPQPQRQQQQPRQPQPAQQQTQSYRPQAQSTPRDYPEDRQERRPGAAVSQGKTAAAATGEEHATAGQSVQRVAAQLTSMRTSLLIRVIVNTAALIMVIYLALAGSYNLPMPEFMAGEANTGVFLWCTVLIVALSAVVSGNTVGGGILALFKLSPSNDTYTSLTVFACLIQGSYMAMQPQLMAGHGDNLYLPMAALMLLFNTLGKLIMLSRMCGSFALVAAKGAKQVAGIMDNREFAKRISAGIISDEPSIVYFTQAAAIDGFLDQAFSESKAEDISKIIAPMTALAALVMALISYIFSRDIFTAACVYTAALCITAPLAGVIASNLPLSITNGKLARWGATLCGYDAVNRFSTANGVILKASQLFPKGSVAVQDIIVLDRRPIDQVIVDSASVFCGCDSDLSEVFGNMVQDHGMLYTPENLEYIDDMGISAWVNGRRILLGNRNLMMSYGVAMPDAETERQYLSDGIDLLYLANSGEISALYLLNYRADKQMRRAMALLCDSDMGVCIYSNDPNVTLQKVSGIYSFPQELLTIIPASMQAGSERYISPRPTAEASVLHNGSTASCLRTILAARSCSRCITLQTAMLLMSVVIGFAIVTFFAFTRQMESLTWVTLTVYQFFWLLLELVIPLFKH